MTIRDLILSRIEYDTNGGCWLWAGSTEVSLRGKLTIAPNKQVLAYRASYEAFVGVIPDGMMICHRCDVPACVRPDHLFIGTAKDNVADMIAKGRRKNGDIPKGSAHPSSKLTDDEVMAIRALEGRFSDRRVAKFFGVRSSETIRAIWTRKTWHHLPEKAESAASAEISQAASVYLAALPPKKKLAPEVVAYIREVYTPRDPQFGAHALAERFGVTHGAISMAARGKTWGARNGVVFHEPAQREAA